MQAYNLIKYYCFILGNYLLYLSVKQAVNVTFLNLLSKLPHRVPNIINVISGSYVT